MNRETVTQALKRQFGYAFFRPGQLAIVERALQGRNVLGLLATGGGKSITYQLPATLLPGITVVVSPLIALMIDQVQQLRTRYKMSAAFINSSLDPLESKELLRDIRIGKYKLLYISPEKLQQSQVQKVLAERGVSLVAIDEAHCISSWGHDFRTDYMRLPAILAVLGSPPIIAVTATATPEVRSEICHLFRIEQEDVITSPLNRDNISIDLIRVQSETDRRSRVLEAIENLQGPGIVYCSTRQAVDSLVSECHLAGIENVHGYHGGLSGMDRVLIQEQFLRNELEVIIATNAFGMGIDKPDIRYVLHYHHPASMEAYSQEIGRVGRDGNAGYAALYYMPDDILIHGYMLQNEYPTMIEAERFVQLVGSCKGELRLTELVTFAGIDERLARLLFFYAEQTGLVSAVVLTREGYHYEYNETRQQISAGQIYQLTEQVKNSKQMKLQKMIHWLQHNQCLRLGLTQYFGTNESQHFQGYCCSYCGRKSVV